MVQVNENAMRSGAHELSPASLRPTIYRPSGPATTRVSSAIGIVRPAATEDIGNGRAGTEGGTLPHAASDGVRTLRRG